MKIIFINLNKIKFRDWNCFYILPVFAYVKEKFDEGIYIGWLKYLIYVVTRKSKGDNNNDKINS